MHLNISKQCLQANFLLCSYKVMLAIYSSSMPNFFVQMKYPSVESLD